MAAHENLSEYQFRFRPTGPRLDYPGYSHDFTEDDGYSLWDYDVTAIHKPTGRPVGEFLWHTDGPLFMVNVNREHQRRGVATGMAKKAYEVSKASKGRITPPSRANSETEGGRLYGEEMEKRGYLEKTEWI